MAALPDIKQANEAQIVRGRFAPSPSGRMHAGNVFSALCAWLIAKSQGGEIVLRIEDLDRERSKQEYIDLLMRDFEFLGLEWDKGPFYQHDREEAYEEAFAKLCEKGLVYPCFCSRADLHAASAPHEGDRFIYARTCFGLSEAEIKEREHLRSPAYRLSVSNSDYCFVDLIQGECSENLETSCGDFVIRRFDKNFAYQLAVVVDDAEQGINSVVRGNDLLSSCGQQMYLQDLLGLPNVQYAHIPLFVDEEGRRLAKRNKDAAMDELLVRYKTPEAIIGHIAYIAGLQASTEPVTPHELLDQLDCQSLCATLKNRRAILFGS